ncbi:TadE/TadG family type IV pilus assembly protein [Neobacillus sp. D3-1R]|uniref:TadE/TadG family type IV pilus assembly protein n=1 Tax=Neobacillus sp. D3-1R TaxID=3445778 RepID=UPI003F9FD050
MKKIILNLFKREQGNAIVFAAIAFMGLLGMAGLAIDGGLVYMTKSHLQKVANSAVLSGAQELTNQEDKVETIVMDILKSHKEESSLEKVEIEMEKRVAVDLNKPVQLSFARLFGFEKMDVQVHAAAELRTMGRAVGAAPLGIDDRIPLEYLKPYQLKVDSSGVEYGNFGVLALGSTGAKPFEENLRNGYQEELQTGMVLETQTGNIAGKTREVIQERVNGCTEMPRDVNDRDCSRVILVPVYKPNKIDQNQLKSVEITGFAYFYITDPMDSKDTSIRGMFIKRAGTGFEEEGSLFKGAYSIRLTE